MKTTDDLEALLVLADPQNILFCHAGRRALPNATNAASYPAGHDGRILNALLGSGINQYAIRPTPLTDNSSKQVIEELFSQLNINLDVSYSHDSADERQHKMGVLLSYVPSEDKTITNPIYYFTTAGEKTHESCQVGFYPLAFKAMLREMGPYLFFNTIPGRQDHLLTACQSVTHEVDNRVNILLEHYFNHLPDDKCVDTFRASTDRAEIDPKMIINTGIIEAIIYSVNLGKFELATYDDKNKSAKLIQVIKAYADKRIYVMENDKSAGFWTVGEYIAYRISGNKEKIDAVQINEFLSSLHVAQKPKSAATLNYLPTTPAGWGASVFLVTFFVVACVEGGLWDSSFVNRMLEHDGSPMTDEQKGPILGFSAFVCGLVGGGIAYGVARMNEVKRV